MSVLYTVLVKGAPNSACIGNMKTIFVKWIMDIDLIHIYAVNLHRI